MYPFLGPQHAHDDMSDFVTNVRGVEVSPHAPVIDWPNGSKTVVPFILEKSNTINSLPQDEEAVRTLARLSKRGQGFEFIKHLHPRTQNLAEECRKLLSHGNVVVIEQYTTSPAPQVLNEAYLEERLEIDAQNRYFEAHDAKNRHNAFHAAHVQVTIQEFLQGLQDHEKIRCILSIPSTTQQVPEVIRQMDHAHRSMMADLVDVFPPGADKISLDTVNLRSWHLLHGAGWHTLAHKDAEGLATYIIVESGVKMWCIIRPGNGYLDSHSYPAWHQRTKVMIDYLHENSYARKWEAADPQVAFIQLEPGDLLLMPPGAWHEVYTPIQGHCSGGHFLSCDFLHLSALSRKFDSTNGLISTNDSHPSIFHVLCRMLLNMVRLQNRGHVFHRTAVLAHCRMILHPRDYAQQGQHHAQLNADKKKDDCRLAAKMASHILKVLRVADIKNDLSPFFDPTSSWTNPGPTVDLTDALEMYSGSVLLRKGDTHPVSVSDLLSAAFSE